MPADDEPGSGVAAAAKPAPGRRWRFAVFFLSGFSGLLYQIVWLRLAFAAFGIITPVMSVLLSVFMLGLGLGSWLAGSVVARRRLSGPQALGAYAAAEIVIGCGGFIVPLLFKFGEQILLPAGETDSLSYLTSSAGIMLLALLPFCLAMGCTFPLMMQSMRATGESSDSFSFLYLANVIGAMCGTLLTPLALVELLGFHKTLWIGAGANFTAAVVSLWFSRREAKLGDRTRAAAPATSAPAVSARPEYASGVNGEANARFRLAILFSTGLAAMAIEVVWTRAFTPVLKTQVYSFSGLLFTYLLATWCGSWLYRRHLVRGRVLATQALLPLLALAAFAQLLLTDPRVDWRDAWVQVFWTLSCIVPYCGLLGYLTPKLVDEYSAGNPQSAGRAYAVNVLGCILGPLLASYVLLPNVGVHWSGMLLAIPLWTLAGLALYRGGAQSPTTARPGGPGQNCWSRTAALWGLATLCGILAGAIGRSYEEHFARQGVQIRRDYTATVASYQVPGPNGVPVKGLLVNGTSITILSTVTKFMAHLPLCHLREPPRAALVICFGMGTTYRSLLSWDIDTTAVELVPSVRDSFDYYFPDAPAIRKNPRAKTVIDDGRRFLRRTAERFDVITLDPPPPVEAAGSSLLYSKEFYELVKPRLTEQGILQQWYPSGEWQILQAVVRSVQQSFPHVRVMSDLRVKRGYNERGVHILASMQPIPKLNGAELAARLPAKAASDLCEWERESAAALFEGILAGEVSVESVLNPDPAALIVDPEVGKFDPAVVANNPDAVITDDRPFNEYYLVRRLRPWLENVFEVCAGPQPRLVKWSKYFQ